jgi:predicted nucleotidyltransferase
VPNGANSSPPIALRKAFEALVETLNERGINYAIIGGLATIQHTRPRATIDIDALLTVPQISMPGLFQALEQKGFSVNLKKNIVELRDHGLTSIHFGSVLVDLMQPVLPAYAHVLDRAIDSVIQGLSVRISSAEGLIVMKVIAMRPQDEADIRELLIAYPATLDIAYVNRELDSVMPSGDPRRLKFNALISEFPEYG